MCWYLAFIVEPNNAVTFGALLSVVDEAFIDSGMTSHQECTVGIGTLATMFLDQRVTILPERRIVLSTVSAPQTLP
jgi:hypothetical protein